ncbi:MAG TPA: hypothetical protein VII56_03115 [Rhizomicrobium sp.]
MKIVPILAMAVAVLAALPAQSAVSVLGSSGAHSCYVSAGFDGNAKAGIVACTEALTNEVLTNVDRASTLINRAILLARARNTDGALEDYAAALALGGNDGEVYLNRSAVFITLKRYDDALKDADRAITLGAGRMEIAYYNRAVANEELGNVGAAFEDYKTALRLEPRFAAASNQLRRFRVVIDTKGT